MNGEDLARMTHIVEQGGLLDPNDGRALTSALRAHHDGCALMNNVLDTLGVEPCAGRVLDRLHLLAHEVHRLRGEAEKAREERDVSEAELFQTDNRRPK